LLGKFEAISVVEVLHPWEAERADGFC